jgi:hypothetical protein
MKNVFFDVKTATVRVSVDHEVLRLQVGFKLFLGRCHTNVIMDAFLQEPVSHSHAPNPNRFHVIRLQNGIKERSESTEEATSIILHNALRTVPLNIAAELPSTDALGQCIRRQRPAPSLDINSRLPQILKQTDRGENFVVHEDDSMIIFTSKSNLNALKECQHWFCDGTFSVSIRFFDRLTYLFLFRYVQINFSSYSQFMVCTPARSCHWYMPCLLVKELWTMISSLRSCYRNLILIQIRFLLTSNKQQLIQSRNYFLMLFKKVLTALIYS